MPYKITVSDDKKYIITKSIGGLNNDIAGQQNREAQALAMELGIDRFLVDMVESSYEGGPIEHYEFANTRDFTPDRYNRYARVAILVRPDDDSHDFFETVARNAGFDITIFRNREEAIQHLIGDM
jgi:hypothetical protein